jgi:3-phosphoinositide dependent protein kinase-1
VIAPRTNTFVGTAAYISPEILAKEEVNPKRYIFCSPLPFFADCERSPDLWAIGCTIFFFLFGASPFLAANDYLTMGRVRALDYTIPDVCDNDAADLIKRLLVRHPSRCKSF